MTVVDRDLRLVVCGCSSLACDIGFPNTHFSEVLANTLGLQLISLARQGISNSGIRLQIDRALELGADFVIFNSTSANRFEVPLHKIWPHVPQQTYQSSMGLDNIDYRYCPNPSQDSVDSSHATLLSDHISKFYDRDFDQDFVNAWKHYISYIYDESWKQQQDQWIVESSLNRLIQSGVKFIYMPMWDQIQGDTRGPYTVPDWVPSRSVYDAPNLRLLDFRPVAGRIYPTYHTTPEFQHRFAQIFAPFLQQIIDS